MTISVYLVEAEVRIDALGTSETLRFATGLGYNHPSAPGYFAPRLLNPLVLRRSLFASGTTSGAVGVGAGAVDLANADGGLDALIGYGFDGGRLILRRVDADKPYGSAVTLAVLTMEQPEFTWGRISIRVRDRLQDLEAVKLQPTLYAGSNTPPDGLEGGPGDLKGQPKVRAFGRVRNAPIVCVNTARLIYHVNDGPVAEVAAVYDRGASIAIGPPYTNDFEMQGVTPSPGTCRVWAQGGFLRLGSNPVGQVTADIVAGASLADRSAAGILRAMALGPGGIDPADVVAADLTELQNANPAELGFWVNAETSLRAAMETVANAVGAWFGFDREGRLRFRRFEPPTTPPVALLTRLSAVGESGSPGDILSIERRPTDDPGRGVPSYRARLTYQRNWTVQDSDLAGVVGVVRREFLRQSTRVATAEDASVRLRYRGAGQRDFASLIDAADAAQAECERRLTLHKVRRDRLVVRVRFDGELAAAIDLGVVVRLALPRFGFDAGKFFTVIGLDLDVAAGVADLDLWG